MAQRHVEVIVRRGGRQEDRQPAVVDVRDVIELQTWLTDWLNANRWHERHWPDFTAEFHTGQGRPIEVRVSG